MGQILLSRGKQDVKQEREILSCSRLCTETPRRRIVNETADNLFWASSLVRNREPRYTRNSELCIVTESSVAFADCRQFRTFNLSLRIH